MASNEHILEAAQIIKNGGTVAFPTETVYGLGANALDSIAVAKIFELKQRPSFDPLIVHIADSTQIEELSPEHNHPEVRLLTKEFWPGPLTLVVPKNDIVPDIVTAGLNTIGIRMPAHPVARELIRKSRCPIAAPSANPFGQISPTEAEHVKRQLKGVDMILDGGKTDVGIESTIVKLLDNGWAILRHGRITQEQLEQFVNIVHMDHEDAIQAPGMMKSHYSPIKPFYILNPDNYSSTDKSNAGLISFTGKFDDGFRIVKNLTQSRDTIEYAANLFSAMHELQSSDIKVIFAEAVPKKGIGIAVMDKLEKAAYKHSKE